MTLCAPCEAGSHPHDRHTHDGTDAGCPNLARDHQHPNDGCTCAVQLPAMLPNLHRCTCGHVHETSVIRAKG